MLTPPAIVKLAAHLAPHADMHNVRALQAATGDGGAAGGGTQDGTQGLTRGDGGAGGDGDGALAALARTPTNPPAARPLRAHARVDFVMDVFNRYRFHVQTCMDAFAFRTAPLLATRAGSSLRAHAWTAWRRS